MHAKNNQDESAKSLLSPIRDVAEKQQTIRNGTLRINRHIRVIAYRLKYTAHHKSRIWFQSKLFGSGRCMMLIRILTERDLRHLFVGSVEFDLIMLYRHDRILQ